jgi:predicted ATPase
MYIHRRDASGQTVRMVRGAETNKHAYIPACMHEYIHTYICTRDSTRQIPGEQRYAHAYMHTYIHTYIQANLRDKFQDQADGTKACTHTYLHSRIHTYIHTYIQATLRDKFQDQADGTEELEKELHATEGALLQCNEDLFSAQQENASLQARVTELACIVDALKSGSHASALLDELYADDHSGNTCTHTYIHTFG